MSLFLLLLLFVLNQPRGRIFVWGCMGHAMKAPTDRKRQQTKQKKKSKMKNPSNGWGQNRNIESNHIFTISVNYTLKLMDSVPMTEE